MVRCEVLSSTFCESTSYHADHLEVDDDADTTYLGFFGADAGTIFVRAAKGVGAAQRHNFFIVKSHSVKDFSKVFIRCGCFRRSCASFTTKFAIRPGVSIRKVAFHRASLGICRVHTSVSYERETR